MCVIFFSLKQSQEYPFVLLANRDEFYERPTAKADFWEDYPQILAGRDLVGKGTWLGLTKTGRFSAVTNFRDPARIKGVRSRGDLVADFLKSDIPAKEYLHTVASESDQYAGFNLLVGEFSQEQQELFYFSNQEGKIRKLPEGLYGLSNNLLDVPWRKVTKGKEKLSELLADKNFEKQSLFEVLADKDLATDAELPDTGIGYEREKLLSSIFIETPIYGTRCSTVVTFNKRFEMEFDEIVFV